MPEMPNAVKTRLQAWWATLDDGNHAIFEAIYLEAPAAVSRAISGGEWVADSAHPGLAAQLGTDPHEGAHALQQVPSVVVPNAVEVHPYHATPGQKVQFTWTEENNSHVDLAAYVTDVYVQDANGATIKSERLNNGALAAGATAQRTWEFEGAPVVGTYTFLAYVNAEGVDPGVGVPGTQGYRSATMAQFGVGADEDQASGQDHQILATFSSSLINASQATPPSAAFALLQEALNWLAGVDWLLPDEHTEIQRVHGALQQLPNHYLQEIDREPTDVAPNPTRDAFVAKQHRLSGAAVGSMSTPNDRAVVFRAIGAFAEAEPVN